MTRSILGVVAGILAAFVVVLAVETIALPIFPQPAGMNPTDPDSVRAHLSEIHTGSFVMVVVAWSLAAFVGPVVARRIAGAGSQWAPLIVIGLFAMLCVYNLIVVPSPPWMIPVAIITVGAASMLAHRSRIWSRP